MCVCVCVCVCTDRQTHTHPHICYSAAPLLFLGLSPLPPDASRDPHTVWSCLFVTPPSPFRVQGRRRCRRMRLCGVERLRRPAVCGRRRGSTRRWLRTGSHRGMHIKVYIDIWICRSRSRRVCIYIWIWI